MKVWCVRHRDGWCATATGKKARDSALSVKTKCGNSVILHWGSQERQPNCPECLSELSKRRRK